MIRLALLIAVCASTMACAAPAAPVPSQTDLAADGRTIAETQCAACHAIADAGDSPNSAAPPFRTVLSRFNADALEEELIEGIQVAHPMPEFQFNPQGADALIAYLKSIQVEAPPEPEQ